VREDGEVEPVGCLRPRVVVRVAHGELGAAGA
jgi:hypothetical protein